MNFYIALTDQTWFNNLRYMKDLDEVNSWKTPQTLAINEFLLSSIILLTRGFYV